MPRRDDRQAWQTEVIDDIHEDPSLCDERTEHSRTSEFNTERDEYLFTSRKQQVLLLENRKFILSLEVKKTSAWAETTYVCL